MQAATAPGKAGGSAPGMALLLIVSLVLACGFGVAGGERAGAGLGGAEASKAASELPPRVTVRNQAKWEIRAELQQQKVGGRAFHRSVPPGEAVVFGGLPPEQYAVILTQPNSPGIVARLEGVAIQESSDCTVVFNSERQYPGRGEATIECK